MRAGLTAAAGVLAAVLLWAGWLSGLPEVGQGAVPVGAAGRGSFGVVLQRSRFCFYCIARDFIQRREASGLYAVLIALAAGAGLSRGVRRLSAGAGRRSPPSGRAYRAGERGAGGRGVCVPDWACGSRDPISAHFYRIGEGAPGSPFALLGGGRLRAGLCLLEHAVPVADPAGAGDLAAASSGLWRLGAAAMRGAGGAGVGSRACRGRTSPRAMPATPRPMRGRSRCGCAGPPPQAGWPWPSSP